jgi:hypothetical protein
VAAAIASYYSSSAFKHLSPGTQQVRRAVLDVFKREHGDKLIRHMPRKFIIAYLDAMPRAKEAGACEPAIHARRAMCRACSTEQSQAAMTCRLAAPGKPDE